MSKLKDNSLQYKTEIKHGFEILEPGNNLKISTEKLNDISKAMNSKKNNPFLYNTIKSLTAQKEEENEENISFKEYMSFLDDQLDDIESKDGLQKIFSVFCDSNQSSFSWTKLPLIVKELGDNEMANKLLKLIEQADLYNKDLNFKEFSEIMNTDYEIEKNLKIDNSEDYEDMESYRQKKRKYKKKEDNEEGTVSSKNSYRDKNEENKKSGEDIEEKSSKRYHRRYRDNKSKNDNNENGNGVNKVHSKYRKKHS
jgi:Ca2+-binding EF-hand superfamily protein